MSQPPSFVYASVSSEMVSLDEELQSLGGGDTKLERASLYHFVHPRSAFDEQTIWINEANLDFRDITLPKSAPTQRAIKSFPHSAGAISLDPYVKTDTGNDAVEQICSRINEGFNVCMLNLGTEGSDKSLALWGVQDAHTVSSNTQINAEDHHGRGRKLLSHDSFIHAILQNLYHHAAIYKASEMTRISISMFCLHNTEIIDLLTPYSLSPEPLEFCNIYCKDMQTALDVLKQAHSRLPSTPSQVMVKVMVHKSDLRSDEGGLSTLYIVDTVNLVNLSKSASFRALEEKDKVLERARQLELNCLLSMLQDMRQISSSTNHTHVRMHARVTSQNDLVDTHSPPARRLVQARNSKLTTILAPILQGNMSLCVCAFMNDAVQAYYTNKELLTHVYKVSDVVSACYKVKGVCWTELSMMFPEQVLPVQSTSTQSIINTTTNTANRYAHHSHTHTTQSQQQGHVFSPNHPASFYPPAFTHLHPPVPLPSPGGASVQTVHTDYGDIDLEAIVGGLLDNGGDKSASNNLRHSRDHANKVAERVSLEGHIPFSELVDVSERAKGSLEAMAPKPLIASTYLFNQPPSRVPDDKITQGISGAPGSAGSKSVSTLMEEFHSLVKAIQTPPAPSPPESTATPNPVELYATLLYGEKPKFFIDHSSLTAPPRPPSLPIPSPSLKSLPTSSSIPIPTISSHLAYNPTPPPPPSIPPSLGRYGQGRMATMEVDGEVDGGVSLEELCQPSPYTTSLKEKWVGSEVKTSPGEGRSKGGLMCSSYEWGSNTRVNNDNGDNGGGSMEEAPSSSNQHTDSRGSSTEEDGGDTGSSADDSLDDVRRMNNLPNSSPPPATPSSNGTSPSHSYTPSSTAYSHDSMDQSSSTPSPPRTPPNPTMPDYFMPVMQPSEPTVSDNPTSSSVLAKSFIPQYKDDAIPTNISDLTTAMRVIEHLRRTQDSLVQALTNVTKEKELIESQCASAQQDVIELKTEKEVYMEAYEYEKKTLYVKLQGAMQDADCEGVFMHLQHECDRLQRENKVLQDENLKLELRAGDQEKLSVHSSNKPVDVSVEHYHKQVQDLSSKLRKGKVAYTQLQSAYEELKNKERTFLIQSKLTSANQLKYKHLFAEHNKIKQQYDALQLKHLELMRQYEHVQSYSLDLKDTNDRVIHENMCLNQDLNALQRRYDVLDQERIQSGKMKKFLNKHGPALNHSSPTNTFSPSAYGYMPKMSCENDPPSLGHNHAGRILVAPTEERKGYEGQYAHKRSAESAPVSVAPAPTSNNAHGPGDTLNYSIQHIQHRVQTTNHQTDVILGSLEENLMMHNPALLPLVRKLTNEVHIERLKALGEKSKLLDKIKVDKKKQ